MTWFGPSLVHYQITAFSVLCVSGDGIFHLYMYVYVCVYMPLDVHVCLCVYIMCVYWCLQCFPRSEKVQKCLLTKNILSNFSSPTLTFTIHRLRRHSPYFVDSL